MARTRFRPRPERCGLLNPDDGDIGSRADRTIAPGDTALGFIEQIPRRVRPVARIATNNYVFILD